MMCKLFRIMLVVLVCLAFSISMPADIRHASSTDTANNDSSLLQFTSGGHVLGFGSNSVYISGLDHALRMEFPGGRQVQPLTETADISQSGTDTLGKVTYSNVWDNIDIIYSAAESGIAESTYIVHPGGNPASIRFRYNTQVDVQQNGSLRFSFNSGYMIESAPLAWQEIEGQHIARSVAFQKDILGEITIALAAYDSRYPLYIDPAYSWHTFFGTLGGNDTATSITLDSSLNVYVAGFSTLPWNGPAGQAPLNAFTIATFNTVIVKLSNSGAYLWHTFYPYAVPIGLARTTIVTDGPSVYISGGASASWNGPAGQLPLHTYTASRDIFVLNLDQSGGYRWHTFYGSTADDVAAGMKAAGGYLYITGWAYGTWNGPTGQAPLHTYNASGEIFVLKLDESGGYRWHTFYGGVGIDMAWVLALDSSSNVYVGGYSDGTWNGPAGQAPLHTYNAGKDGFVLKLNRDGTYQWHSFYGGPLNDWVSAMSVDSNGNIYALGYCQATWNGPAAQAPLHTYTAGADNVAIFKLSSDGAYQWHTFYRSVIFVTPLGGGLAVDSDANVYVGGISNVTQLGPDGQAPLNPYVGGIDIVILKLNSSGAYQWHTFYGGAGDDAGIDLALDPCRNIYVDGISTLTWNGPNGQLPLNSFSTGAFFDIIVLKMASAVPPIVSSFKPTSGEPGTQVTITGTGFSCATAVAFGGTPAASFTVNSDTQITATAGNGTTGQITVTTLSGTGTSAANFNFDSKIGTAPRGSTISGSGSANAQQGPVSLPTVSVRSASLSASRVGPGAPVTVTASIANTGAVNGTGTIKVYVNGQEESSRGVTLNSGSSTPVTFIISRNEPGTYTVYVGGTNAGSFTVDQFTPETILIVSGALVFFAFIIGAIVVTRRRA
jgi:hypothetical protein